MMDATEVERFNRRTKMLDVEPLENDRIRFESTLVDQSFGGFYEDEHRTSAVVHHFALEGIASGPDLLLESLDVSAIEHPFGQCPFVLPAVDRLIGSSLLSNWRRNVLEHFRGTAGCTHVTALLLGLSEVTTLVYFQRMNALAPYGPRGRASGAWIAGSLDLGQDLGGACHALAVDGPVLRRAESYRKGNS